MGAFNPVSTEFIPDRSLQQKFDAELAQRTATVTRTPFTPSSYNASIKTPSLSGLALPAMIGFEGLKMAIAATKKSYEEKIAEYGLNKPSGGTSETPTTPPPPLDAPTAPSPVPFVTPPYDNNGINLISVLQKSGSNINSVADAISHSSTESLKGFNYIAESIMYSNSLMISGLEILNTSIQDLTSATILASDTAVAYKELDLNNSASDMEVNQAYRDSTFSVLADISTSLNDIASKNSLSVNIPYPIDIFSSAGVDIKKSESETALVNAKLDMTTKNLENHTTATDLLNKKLEHITFETTEFQAPSYEGNDIPSATPQTMRAIKDAHVAKKNNDENTFEVEPDDYEDMFAMPDITEIFTWFKESDRLREVTSSVGGTA